MSGLNRLLLACGVALGALLLARGGLGQELQEIKTPDGRTIKVPAGANIPPEVLERMRSGRRPSGGPPGRPDEKKEDEGKDEEKKGEEGKDEDKDKKEAEEKKEGEKGEATESVKRESEPPEPGDPKELEVKPDKEGKVEFNFANQKWLGVLDWLAGISNMSLDWQELPGDYLNLTTQRKHTIRETRDLIQARLLDRGFTLLPVGDVLSVAKIENLNPALVPRVRPEELAERDPHEWVKVSFPLDWMLAEDAVKELEPMKSPHGKLHALATTNRLEAMDAVKNLREIYQVLEEEQSGEGEQGLVKVFHLEYTSAESVVEQLRDFLGLESKSSSKGPPAGPMTPDQMRAQAEAMKQAQEAAKKGGAPSKPEPKIQLIANRRENSILALAPPDKMAIIVEAVKALDVPRDHVGFRDRAMIRMQVYFLQSIEPEPLIETLEELGEFDYYTRLVPDKENNAIIAYASLADQLTISSLIQKLDEGGRGPEVIQLDTLRAESAARTIAFIMLGEKEEEEESRSRSSRSYFSPFGFYPSRSSSYRRSSDDDKDQFRVSADAKTNSLYLWCNQFELAKVHDILDSLRQSQGEGGDEYSVQVYRLVSLDPEPFVKTLEEMETLGFHAKLEIDEENNTIIAHATEADHAKIRDLIEKLDGSTREIHVIPLRQLEADYVAGTIAYLMAGKDDKQQSSGYSRTYIYNEYYGGGPSRGGKEKPPDEFRVDADVEYNRLLVWANEIELEEVMNLLVKLGEIPPEGGNTSTIRVLDVLPGPEREKLLERIRRIWPSLAPNQLIPPDKSEEKKGEKEGQEEEAGEEKSEEKAAPSGSRPATAAGASGAAGRLEVAESRSAGSLAVGGGAGRPVFQLALLEQEAADSAAAQPSGESPEQEVPQPAAPEQSKQQPQSETSPTEPSEGSQAPLQDKSITEKAPAAAEPQPQQEAGQAETPQETEPQPASATESDAESPGAAPKSAQPPSVAAPAEGTATLPPVSITEAPDGRLIITSEDTKALDRLEELIGRLSPRRKDYEVFKLLYAEAYWVKWNLEDFFEEEEKADTSMSRYYSWYWDYPSSSGSTDSGRRLSRRRPLRFISDDDTNTILVQGATPDQLATIAELIELYDQRPSMDSESARRTQIFLIRYSEAESVAEAVKDVYRDLLSDRDKALANRPDQQQRQESRYSYTYVFGDEEGERKMPRWKGYLSIGIDSLSNSLIVSAPEFLFRDIEKLITELDEAAKPADSVGLVQLGNGVSASVVQEALGKVLSESAAGGRRAEAGAEQPGQNNGRRSNGRNGRPGN